MCFDAFRIPTAALKDLSTVALKRTTIQAIFAVNTADLTITHLEVRDISSVAKHLSYCLTPRLKECTASLPTQKTCGWGKF